MKAKKCIFITGAASGIGKAVAKFFAKNNWFVGLYDIDQSPLSSLSQTLGKDNCCYGCLDVTDNDDVKNAMEHFSSFTGGRMNVLVNCAGRFRVGPFTEIQIQDHKSISDVNIFGILNCTYHAFPYLKNTDKSTVISMSSGVSIYGWADFSSYSASKFWVRGFTEALHVEWAHHGITVCDIVAPMVDTPMIRNHQSIKKINLLDKKAISPEMVAKTIWRAAYGKRVHWKVGLLFAMGCMLMKHLPEALISRVLKKQYLTSLVPINEGKDIKPGTI